MKHTSVKRISKKCIDAIEDIRKKVLENTRIEIGFIECSELLGEKYIRGQLGTIPFDEIIQRFGKKKRGKQWGVSRVI